MNELLKKFVDKKPEIVFEWKDPETEAMGWVVINSLRGGAAGGGTRMRPGLDRSEVESLAKTMEVKFTVSGPPIGGAKSGINFDPSDPRKIQVLERWYAAVKPLLKYYYGTGGDLNVDEGREVIPIIEDVGIWHPQEGVFTGHYKPTEPQMVNRIGQLRLGVVKVVEHPDFTPNTALKYSVADMATGYGVAESIRHYYDIWGGEIKGKRAVIQGFGNVGAAAAFFLTQMGVKITGIIDRSGGLINPEGYGRLDIVKFISQKKGNQLMSDDLISFEEANEKIWGEEFEIFVPAASSRLLTRAHVEGMANSGLEVMACGANVPFADHEIFLGPIGLYADARFSVIPDFIANCGMARVFAYFMETEVNMVDEEIFNDISNTIKKALVKTHATNSKKTGIASTSLEAALRLLL